MATPRSKPKRPERTNDEIRTLLLRYFYDRNAAATSARGKRGAAAKISTVLSELKSAHQLARSEVWSNLTYLLSQGWIEEERLEKQVPVKSGMVIPQTTVYYKVTAAGIDKIEGPGEFTMDKFRGVRIEATGQNIITLGDGNQVDARYQDVAGALVDLKSAMLAAPQLSESQKLGAVSDIDTIQAQLAKPEPSRSILGAAWEGVKGLAVVAGLTVHAERIARLITPLL